MPRLKVSSSEESSRVVRACINGNMALYNVSEDQMAVKMGGYKAYGAKSARRSQKLYAGRIVDALQNPEINAGTGS